MEAPSHPTQESIIHVSPETESDQELRELKREYVLEKTFGFFGDF